MYITKEEQARLFAEYKTPPHIQAHCNAVAEAARKLASALNEHGYNLDVDAIYGAGLVHDMVRLTDDHAGEGARILKELGYDKEAALVKEHMTYKMVNEPDQLEEIDVLCLGDRTVCEGEYVGLDKRMEYLINKTKTTPERTARILMAKKRTQSIIDGIEDIIGQSFDSLLG